MPLSKKLSRQRRCVFKLYGFAGSVCNMPIPVDTRNRLLAVIDEALRDLEALPFMRYLDKKVLRLGVKKPKGETMKTLSFTLAFIFLFVCHGWAASLQLSWTDLSDNEDGFKIERRLGQIGAFTEVGQVGENITTYIDTTPDGQVYCYQVKAFNIAGEVAGAVACSPIVVIIPNAPGGLVIIVLPVVP